VSKGVHLPCRGTRLARVLQACALCASIIGVGDGEHVLLLSRVGKHLQNTTSTHTCQSSSQSDQACRWGSKHYVQDFKGQLQLYQLVQKYMYGTVLQGWFCSHLGSAAEECGLGSTDLVVGICGE
jgi:hypothetical protein